MDPASKQSAQVAGKKKTNKKNLYVLKLSTRISGDLHTDWVHPDMRRVKKKKRKGIRAPLPHIGAGLDQRTSKVLSVTPTGRDPQQREGVPSRGRLDMWAQGDGMLIQNVRDF